MTDHILTSDNELDFDDVIGANGPEAQAAAETQRQQRNAELDALLNGREIKNAPADAVAMMRKDQFQKLQTICEARNLVFATESRKQMQMEPHELTEADADKFLSLFSTPTPEFDDRSNVDRQREAIAAANANSAGAATAVAKELVPQFGEVLATAEPNALAYGFPPEVDALIKKAKLSPEQSRDLLAKFGGLFEQIGNWAGQVDSLVIAGVEDKEGIERAKELHKIIRDDRLNVEKRKKLIKEPYLRPSQLIDGVFKIYSDAIEPLETAALAKAKYVENLEKAAKEKIRLERFELLKPFVENIHAFDLHPDKMTEEAFNSILESKKELHAIREKQRLEEEAERQRKADDEAAERVRIRRINERTQRLSSLGFIREEEDARYRLEDLTVYDNDITNESDATWASRIEELIPKANAIREAIAVRQREAAAALQQQETAAQEAARNKVQEDLRREAAALAPDRVKLEELATAIEAIAFPSVTNEKTIAILAMVKSDLFQTVSRLRAGVAQLPEAK